MPCFRYGLTFCPTALLAQHAHRDPALMAFIPVLPEIHALPGSEVAALAGHRDRKARLGQHRAHVCGHVVGSFGGMPVFRVTVRGDARHDGLEVCQNGRVSVLAQHQRCAGVVYENLAQTIRNPGSADNFLNRVRNFVRAAAAGDNFDAFLH